LYKHRLETLSINVLKTVLTGTEKRTVTLQIITHIHSHIRRTVSLTYTVEKTSLNKQRTYNSATSNHSLDWSYVNKFWKKS